MKEVFALKKIKRPAREQYKLNLEIPEYTCFLDLKFGILSHTTEGTLKIQNRSKKLLKTRMAYLAPAEFVKNRPKSHYILSLTQGSFEFSIP